LQTVPDTVPDGLLATNACIRPEADQQDGQRQGGCRSLAAYLPRMRPGSPSEVLELTVALDYGQFYLIGQPVQHPSDADLMLQLLDTAIEGPEIASSEGNEVVVVLSPHQNNFAMRLRVERWTVQPPDDLDDWQEAFLTGLVVGDDGLAYESPTMEGATIPVPPGRYAARISGRGFVNRGWPGSTTPGDAWRVQLWPAAGPMPARRLRAWSGPAPTIS
jgi:hypothetical protein